MHFIYYKKTKNSKKYYTKIVKFFLFCKEKSKILEFFRLSDKKLIYYFLKFKGKKMSEPKIARKNLLMLNWKEACTCGVHAGTRQINHFVILRIKERNFYQRNY